MVRIAGFARSEQRHVCGLPAQYHQRGGFTNGDPPAVATKRLAERRGERFKAVKAVDGHPAQGIGPTDNGDVHQPGFNQTFAADHRPRAGRAGRGDRIGRAFELKPAGEEAGRIAKLLLRILPARARFAMGHVAHVLIAFIQPGGAGPQHHGHAVTTDAGDGLVNGGLNLRQRGQQQLVIAGTVCGEGVRDVRNLAFHAAQNGFG